MGIAKVWRFSSSSEAAIAARSRLIRLLGLAAGMGSIGVDAVGGGGGNRMIGGSSRELERGCERRRVAALAATPGTYFAFVGEIESSAPSPADEDEASDDMLSLRARRGWLCRRVFWGLTVGFGGPSAASGVEGEDTFSGKLRLRPRE